MKLRSELRRRKQNWKELCYLLLAVNTPVANKMKRRSGQLVCSRQVADNEIKVNNTVMTINFTHGNYI